MDQSQNKPTYCCPLCDADIPVDVEPKVGQIYYCSYCKIGLKLLKGKGERLYLEFEEED